MAGDDPTGAGELIASPPEEILRIQSLNPSLKVTITGLPSQNGRCYRYNISNVGDDMLRRIKVEDFEGRVLGILPSLGPGECRSLVSKELPVGSGAITVTAMGSSGDTVKGTVDDRSESRFFVMGSGPMAGSEVFVDDGATLPGATEGQAPPEDASAEDIFSEKASPTNGTSDRVQEAKELESVGSPEEILAPPPELNLTIAANRTEGYAGELVSYRSTLRNSGQEILYDIELTCGDKKTTTKFLSPGKEVHLDGLLTVNKSTEISATAAGSDSKGRRWTNISTLLIRELSPFLKVSAEASKEKASMGEVVTVRATVENVGDHVLAGILVSDDLGDIGWIPSLDPGEALTLGRDAPLYQSLTDKIRATSSDGSSKDVYASTQLQLNVLSSDITLKIDPSRAVAYPGERVEITWEVQNSGEEVLRNVTVSGEGVGSCRLKELSPGDNVRMATVLKVMESGEVSVKAQGYGSGETVSDLATIFIRVIEPEISLNLMPEDIEACVGEYVNLTCLITNSGDDDLRDVVLTERDEGVVARLEELAAGDFEVMTPEITINGNRTLEFEVTGKDSMGETWSDSAVATARLVTTAIDLKVRASPSQVRFGEKMTISCIVENRGSVPLYNVFVISKTYGPLGTVDYLLPKRSRTVSVEKPVTMDLEDVVTAEAFTMGKAPVRDEDVLRVKVLEAFGPGSSPGTLPEKRVEPDPSAIGAALGQSQEVVIGEREAEITLSSNDSNLQSSTAAGVYQSNTYPDEENGTKGAWVQGRDMYGRGVGDGERAAAGSNDELPAGSVGNTGYMGGISQLILYIKSLFGTEDPDPFAREGPQNGGTSSSGRQTGGTGEDVVLVTESIGGSVGGSLEILDVMAMPTEPQSGAPVKVSVHARNDRKIRSAILTWGVADPLLARQEILEVGDTRTIPMTREAGTELDGYWSCLVPGQVAGTFVAISVSLSDGIFSAQDGPYVLSWTSRETTGPRSTYEVKPVDRSRLGEKDHFSEMISSRGKEEMLFIESSTVRGRGEVSIKDTFSETSLRYHEDMKGFGSIELELERCVVKGNPSVNFSQIRDISFGEGTLKGSKTLASPTFHGGMGASVTERFNISDLYKSEMGVLNSKNYSSNKLAFSSEQAFNGTWDTRTQYSRFRKKIKEDQQFRGFFETQKKVMFED